VDTFTAERYSVVLSELLPQLGSLLSVQCSRSAVEFDYVDMQAQATHGLPVPVNTCRASKYIIMLRIGF